ncbi:GNAT family N-acetyltransferase [Mycolicibacterium obuense]|uniref:N-acetyltransferase domain-containing protein n=1 Tax=Mycolicibacterium obuense TaxID=1807 RepID=A0A0M2JTM1_9MYCO|nr:GNAT family protein [Mycolicibacterium obuense]KKF00348.1 hypothetical protein WN67_19155 [Mycolicibacterium obuense]
MDESIWPLAGLAVRTPRLRLRYVTDELAAGLAQLAARGVHDPATMPFTTPWTDVASPELEQNTLRYFWRNRSETSAEHWDLNLAADVDGTLVGVCSISTDGFSQHRSAETGSWIGIRYQRLGLGREMRQAALHLIFDGFGAEQATTQAWHDNAASLAVTRSLPYMRNGSSQHTRRDCTDLLLHFAMSRERWLTVRRDDISLHGIEAVRTLLGLP